MPKNCFLKLTFLSLLLFNSISVQANPLKDAWNCAAGVVKANYELASKGVKAADVLGSAPQCVAQATAGDPPLLILTGAMFAINGASPSILPANGCESALKSYAALPIAKSLDAIFSGVIPDSYLDSANAEAQAKLWDFLSTTPPISEVTGRASCGCTFLEAGISVESLVDMLKTIGSAGKKCDKFLENVPGYSQSKSAINNLGEDLLTDQVTHKPVDAYYREDFGGCQGCWEKDSHAMAKAMDSSHDFATQAGSDAKFGIYFGGKNSNGAPSGNSKKEVCKVYFDGHKMSADNAEKVCSALLKQFDTEYQALVPVFKARDALVKKLLSDTSVVSSAAETDCATLYQDQSALTKENDILSCKLAVNKLKGSIDFPDAGGTTSLGYQMTEDQIKAIIQGTDKYYFMEPTASSGAMGASYQALQSNGYNVDQAVKMGLVAFQTAKDELIAQLKYKKLQGAQKEKDKVLAEFNTNVGNIWSDKCPSKNHAECVEALKQAWDVCKQQLSALPSVGSDVGLHDPKQEAAVNKQCQASYQELVLNYTQFSEKQKSITKLWDYCPQQGQGSGQLFANAYQQCKKDVQTTIDECTGGPPQITKAFYLNGKTTQTPEGLGDCSGAENFLKSKWGVDEVLIGNLNGSYSTAVVACNAAGLPGCEKAVSAKLEECKAKVTKQANEVVGGIAIDSPDLQKATNDLTIMAGKCSEAILKVPEKFSKGKEADVLALQIYAKQCPPRSEKNDYAEQCKTELLHTIEACIGGDNVLVKTMKADSKAGAGSKDIKAPNAKEMGSLGNNSSGTPIAAGVPSMDVKKMPATDLSRGITDSATANLQTKVFVPEQQVENCKPKLKAVVDKYQQQYKKDQPASINASSATGIRANARAGTTLEAAGRPIKLGALPSAPDVDQTRSRPELGRLESLKGSADNQLKAAGCSVPFGLPRDQAGQYNCPIGRALQLCEQLKAQLGSEVKTCSSGSTLPGITLPNNNSIGTLSRAPIGATPARTLPNSVNALPDTNRGIPSASLPNNPPAASLPTTPVRNMQLPVASTPLLDATSQKLLNDKSCTVPLGSRGGYECKTEDGMRLCETMKRERKVIDCKRVN